MTDKLVKLYILALPRDVVKRNEKLRFFFLRLALISLAISDLLLFGALFYKKDLKLEPSAIIKLPVAQALTNVSLPILIYHYVEYVKDPGDTIRQSLNILPATFEAQIKTLKESGYTFITPNQIDDLEKGRLAVEKPIIVSFDDGYEDFYTDVLPIIKKYNVRAVAYVVSGFVDHKNYLTSRQLGAVIESNLVEVGAHTVHHLALAKIDPVGAKDEVVLSKDYLEKNFGIKVSSFAYPYGSFNGDVERYVQFAGFSNAVTTVEGTNLNLEGKYVLKRIHPGVRVGKDLIEFIEKDGI